MSVAIYAPSTDFDQAIDSILWIRNCHNKSSLVRELVSFHIFFEEENTPLKFNLNFTTYEDTYTCKELDTESETFRQRFNLSYPVNIARNLARQFAETFFILASDIELYPSENLIENFQDLVLRNPEIVWNKK